MYATFDPLPLSCRKKLVHTENQATYHKQYQNVSALENIDECPGVHICGVEIRVARNSCCDAFPPIQRSNI